MGRLARLYNLMHLNTLQYGTLEVEEMDFIRLDDLISIINVVETRKEILHG